MVPEHPNAFVFQDNGILVPVCFNRVLHNRRKYHLSPPDLVFFGVNRPHFRATFG
jgi:hypothetical protein